MDCWRKLTWRFSRGGRTSMLLPPGAENPSYATVVTTWFAAKICLCLVTSINSIYTRTKIRRSRLSSSSPRCGCGPRHGRSYHRARGARAPPVSCLDFLKRSCQREVYKLNSIGHLRFPSTWLRLTFKLSHIIKLCIFVISMKFCGQAAQCTCTKA